MILSASESIAGLLRANQNVRIVRRPIEPQDEILFATKESSPEDAKIVEGHEFRTFRVDFRESEFTHFCDGSQKKRLVFYDEDMPGYLGFVNAAVMARMERDVKALSDFYDKELLIFGFSESDALKTLSSNFQVKAIDKPADVGMSGFGQAISEAISIEREQMEKNLIEKWIKKNRSGWLLVDGGIYKLSKSCNCFSQIVGVVKSHAKQYFADYEKTKIVLGLKPGERTSVFEINIPGYGTAYSWYLKLMENLNESPVFGLVRIEMLPYDISIESANRISSWIMHETAPLSLPDMRYDRLLYPIRRVEMYLKSLQPTEAGFYGIIGA